MLEYPQTGVFECPVGGRHSSLSFDRQLSFCYESTNSDVSKKRGSLNKQGVKGGDTAKVVVFLKINV